MKRKAWLLAAALLTGTAWAAGGHHAVDDAAILDEGQCELEGWWTRTRGGERLLHAGAGCRVGPVELGAAAEHARQQGVSATGWGLQAKWATEVASGLSLGVSVSPAWQAHVRPRHQGTTAAALLTWLPSESLAIHANLGRDFVHRGGDANRSGAAIEWTPRTGWTLMAERYVEEHAHFLRAGVRWAFAEGWSADASRAQRLRGTGESSWTIGVTRQFGR